MRILLLIVFLGGCEVLPPADLGPPEEAKDKRCEEGAMAAGKDEHWRCTQGNVTAGDPDGGARD